MDVPILKLNDQQLFEHMKSRQDHKSWTLGDLYEVERRGFSVLDADPVLRDEIKTARDKKLDLVLEQAKPLVAGYESFLSKTLLDSKNLMDRVNKSLNLGTTVIKYSTGPINTINSNYSRDFPGMYSIPKSVYLDVGQAFTSLQGITGPISLSASKIQISSPIADQELAISLEHNLSQTMSNLLQEIAESNKDIAGSNKEIIDVNNETNRLLKRDKIDWTDFGIGIVILLVAIAGLLVSIFKKGA